MLLQSGIFDDTTTQEDFDFIEQTLNDAFDNQLETFDETSFLEISFSILNQLGIPAEDLRMYSSSTSQSQLQ